MNAEMVGEFYGQLSKDTLHRLPEIYHSQVVFVDAAHRIEGLTSLISYFESLYQNVQRCEFTIHEQHQFEQNAFLVWTMHLQHPKLANGRVVNVHGTSQLRFQDDKIIYHRDYFDLGEMLYEQLPILGKIIRAVKRRLGQ